MGIEFVAEPAVTGAVTFTAIVQLDAPPPTAPARLPPASTIVFVPVVTAPPHVLTTFGFDETVCAAGSVSVNARPDSVGAFAGARQRDGETRIGAGGDRRRRVRLRRRQHRVHRQRGDDRRLAVALIGLQCAGRGPC